MRCPLRPTVPGTPARGQRASTPARARGKDHPHAVRILARAWSSIIWRCWQEGAACDLAKHTALQRILEQQASQPADPAPEPGHAR
jgi:hypothetical protein